MISRTLSFVLGFLSVFVVVYIMVFIGFIEFNTDLIVNNYFLMSGGNKTKIRSSTPLNVPVDGHTNNVTKIENKQLSNEKPSTSNQIEGRPIDAIDYEKGHKELCKNSWQEDYTKLHQHLLQTNQNKFIFYKCKPGGWGNRLREIICSFHFAVLTRRAFILECGFLDKHLLPRHIKWNFKINKTGLTVRKKSNIILNDINNPNYPNVLQKMLNYSVEYQPVLKGNFYMMHANFLKYDLPVWPDIRRMMGCSFYYLFKKSHELQKPFDKWKEDLGFHNNIVIAIHIRQGDVVFHHNQQDKRYSNLNDIDLSLRCIESMEKLIEEKYKTKKIIWFLAADSEKMKTYVKEKIGSKVKTITGPIEHVGHPTKGNEEAGQLTMFLDFFLIQEADYRFYVTGSTFDNAVDYITLDHTNNVGKGFQTVFKRACIIPTSLKT